MKLRLPRLSNATKLSLSVVSMLLTALFVAQQLNLVGDSAKDRLAARATLCEVIAINSSMLAADNDFRTLEAMLALVAERDATIDSLGVRRADGDLVLDIGRHASQWRADQRDQATAWEVPISSDTGRWGAVEVRFAEPQGMLESLLPSRFGRLVLFLSVVSGILLYFFFRRVLRELNPAKAIPGRVRSALDTIAQGLLVFDLHGNIVLANRAFGRLMGKNPDALLGMRSTDLPWRIPGTDTAPPADATPWEQAQRTAEPQTGKLYDFVMPEQPPRTLLANASPVLDTQGSPQGVLVSLEDVTPLEEKKQQLNRALVELQDKSEEIRLHNEELRKLATIDPLTDCLNRRAFFERFDEMWGAAEQGGHSISVIMIDIDHFKAINDNHGHSTGDIVIRGVAGLLRESARLGDLVCRFGGEEFCVLLPHARIEDAAATAERFRTSIESTRFAGLSVTVSLGVSSTELGAMNSQLLIEQADRSLYAAKESGRNQVGRYDQAGDSLPHGPDALPGDLGEAISRAGSIPYRAVAALLSTLSYRHAESAAHSRRVADLCVAVAEGIMSPTETYNLEIAALLHEIGKVGVPDSILLKSGGLSREEWAVIRRQDRIGVEIVSAAFDCKPVTDILSDYKRRMDEAEGTPPGVAARLLAICDAWDAMTHDRPYREAMTTAAALQELQSCAGTQFDPELVDRFSYVIQMRLANPVDDGRADSHITPEVALSVGQQIEALVAAFSRQDLDGMSCLAHRLKAVAEHERLEELGTAADKLESSIRSGGDLLDVLDCAQDLIDQCRLIHNAWLRDPAAETEAAAAAV